LASRITVSASARIHIGLFDLSYATPRTFGGLGFMVDKPTTVVSAWPDSAVTIVGPPDLQASSRQYIQQKVQDLIAAYPGRGVTVSIRTTIPEHVGLGSKTAMTLAALTAAARATERPVDALHLQRLSSRGGASGVGIHGFFTGGFVVDAGTLGAVPLLPSSFQRPTKVPTLIRAIQMPEEWIVTLILPPGIKVAGEAESNFFRRVTPIPRAEVLEQIALAYHGLIPAVIDDDLATFGKSLKNFSSFGLKAREISGQGDLVSATIASLERVSPCVGMSSMGPLVFAITTSSILNRMPALPPGARIITETRGAKNGFKASDD
jgi:beta-ribofuranosylaminobenzene 5'-phosphate synthase